MVLIGILSSRDANLETGIQGYHIYRLRTASDPPVTRVTSSPVNATSYTHTNGVIGSSTDFMYYVVPVDALGQEGIPSARAWTRRSYLTSWTSQGYLQDYNSGIDTTPDTVLPLPPTGLKIIK